MLQRYSWDEIIPPDEANQAADALVDTWKKIVKQKGNAPDFNFKKKEPTFTEVLHLYLHKLRTAHGLTGFWHNEPQSPYYGADGKLHRTRQDITYCSNVSKRFELVFEFKKVTNSPASFNKYRGEQGIRRFVYGEYSPGEALAAMVAIVELDADVIIEALKSYIIKEKGFDVLAMVKNGKGEYIRAPSETLIQAAAFDTEHKRDKNKAPPTGSIMLAHIFLSFQH